MKVVLSRKGFDSANGGIVSPIFEDGTMISFPIPSHDKDTFDELQYKGTSYSTILSDLHYKGANCCHVDPDLDQSRRSVKINEWEPAFGQIDSSAMYLKNIGIKEGDLFLFFGNFHCVKQIKGHYKYIRKTGCFYKDHDLQVIWGYLQIGEIITESSEQEKFWWHPHSCEERRKNKTNVIFKASKKLSFDEDKPGAGILSFHPDRILTAENCNKATWKKIAIYDTDNIYGNRMNSARDPNTGIYYAGIWQELGLAESSECERWAKSMVLTPSCFEA